MDFLKAIGVLLVMTIFLASAWLIGGLALSILLGMFGVSLGFWKAVAAVFLANCVYGAVTAGNNLQNLNLGNLNDKK